MDSAQNVTIVSDINSPYNHDAGKESFYKNRVIRTLDNLANDISLILKAIM